MNHTLWTALCIGLIFLTELLGAASVFLFKEEIPERVQNAVLGFSAGIMLAATTWSLLLPSLEILQNEWGRYASIPVSAVFCLGVVFMLALGALSKKQVDKSLHSELRAKRLFFAMALHNIPEGLAMGFAFGAALTANEPSAFLAAVTLAIGVGIQNIPEGAAVSLPMKASGKKKREAFFFGAVSALFEPLFAVIGCLFAAYLEFLQGWLLAFSAGAVLFTVAQELLPESKPKDGGALGAVAAALGFAVMLILDTL